MNKPSTKKLSMNAIKFFGYLHFQLTAHQLKLQDYLQKMGAFKNQNQLSQADFVKIVSFSKANLQTFSISDIYQELRGASPLSAKKIANFYTEFSSKFPIQTPSKPLPEDPKKKQHRKKMMKIAFSQLSTFIKQKQPLKLFDECDEKQQGYLTPKQFNKYLIQTQLKIFQSNTIRLLITKSLFQYFPNHKLTKNCFITFFKINHNEKNKNNSQDKDNIQHDRKKCHSQNKQTTNINKIQPEDKNAWKQKTFDVIKPQKIIIPQRKLSIQKPSNGRDFRKQKLPPQPPQSRPQQKNIIQPPSPQQPPKKLPRPPPQHQPEKQPPKPIPPKSEQNNIFQQQNINFKQKFPLSIPFYRLGLPNQEELPYFSTLENLLKTNTIFKDQHNPTTHIGSYKYAAQIFGGNKYEIFMMASSVIQRQKSRIGLARQIQPKDIMQGQLGDCYFLSSIASIISFYPEVIFDKILFSVNRARYYIVKLFIDGEEKIIITDDQFPCKGNQPVFAQPHGRQIWVMLLEKCWAKIFGSYADIQSGAPKEGFRTLTGAPCEYLVHKTSEDEQKIKKKLQQTYEKRYVATISGNEYLQNLSDTEKDNLGLRANHAYSFLKLLKINDELVVKMRNPWGNTIWKGDWSFSSPKWTKQLRNKFNYNYQPDDGSFYIPWKSMIKYFSNFVICKIDPTFLHTSYRISNTKKHKSNYLQITITQTGIYNFSIYQQNARKIKDKKYQYSSTRFILTKETKGKFQYINSITGLSSECIIMESHLTPGIYTAAIKMIWEERNPRQIVFNSYGVEKVSIEQTSREIAPWFKQDVIESYSKLFSGKVTNYTIISIPEAYKEYEFSIQRGIGFVRLKNPSSKKFTSTLSFQTTGLKILKPYTMSSTLNMDPKTEVIMGFWVSSSGYSYQSKETLSYTH